MVENHSNRGILLQYLLDESNKNHEKIFFFRARKEFIMKYIEVDRLGIDDDTILTFTNERVNDYNEKIRGYYACNHSRMRKGGGRISQASL
jgi:hypothetical protein